MRHSAFRAYLAGFVSLFVSFAAVGSSHVNTDHLATKWQKKTPNFFAPRAPHAPLAPMTQAERERFQAVVNSLSQVLSLSEEFKTVLKKEPKPQPSRPLPLAHKRRQHIMRGLLAQTLHQFEATQPTKAPSPLKKAIDENDCAIKVDLPEDEPTPPTDGTAPGQQPGKSAITSFKISVTGAGCPVLYTVSLVGEQTDKGFDGVFGLNFEALTDEARALADVDKADYTGNLNLTQVQTDQSVTIKGKFGFAGTAHSQTEGDFVGNQSTEIDMAISFGQSEPSTPSVFGMSIEGGTAEVFDYRFKDMNAQLRSSQVFDAAGARASYFINDKKVDKNEYEELRAGLVIPGTEIDPIAGPAEDQIPLFCDVNVYSASDLSIADLEAAIANKREPQAMPLQSSASCQQSQAFDLPLGTSKSASIQFEFSAQEVRVNSNICSATGACSAAERFFVPATDAAYADSVAGFTLLTRCKQVPSCGGN